jgi:glycosyltransferase (activator-dependent family)
MVPLAWAFRNAGHEVRVASQPRFAHEITRAGLTAVPVGRDSDHFFRVAGLTPGLLEAVRAGLPPPWDVAVNPAKAQWDLMREGYLDAVHNGHKPDSFPIIAGLVEFARSWRPNLVIWEPLTHAGPIAAAACGAAHVRLLWSIDVFGVAREHFLRLRAALPSQDRIDPLAEWLASYGGRYGYEFTEEMTTGHVTIDQLPPSLRMAAPGPCMSMQYQPYAGEATIARWLWTRPEHPRIALTLGITATHSFAGYTVDTQEILDALADLDIEVVATLAEREQPKLGRIPRNARIVDFVPLAGLVPTCAVVINHAGPGTLLTTARHGVPQLTVPWDFDAPELARRAARQGAALVIPGDQASGERVRASVLRLLTEPAFRERAELLRDEILAMPTPNQVVPELEQVAAARGSVDSG